MMFLQKPFTPQALLQKVREALEVKVGKAFESGDGTMDHDTSQVLLTLGK